jgi:DNA-directed RNA polymerase subunit RPC12/RpoP
MVFTLSLFVYLYFGFRCPRCHALLLVRGASILGGRPMGCPKCGVGMDEPMNRSLN